MSGINHLNSSFSRGRNAERYVAPIKEEDYKQKRPTFEKPDEEDVDTEDVPFLDQTQSVEIRSKEEKKEEDKDPTEQLLSQLNDTRLIQEQIIYIKHLIETYKTTTELRKKEELFRLFITIYKSTCAYPIQGLLLKFIEILFKNATENALHCIYHLLKTNYFIINTLEKKLLYEECMPYIYMVNSLTILAKDALFAKDSLSPQHRAIGLQILYLLLQIELNNKSAILTEQDISFIYSLTQFIPYLSDNKKKRYVQKLTQFIQYSIGPPKKQPFLSYLIKRLFHRFIKKKKMSTILLLQESVQKL
jgi:hypothetical protein